MCGIAGILDPNGPSSPALMERMLDAMEHRGPDGVGAWSEDAITLGHRRLAIIDTSDNGLQPMHYGGRYAITFNGEIYNYIELREELRGLGVRITSETDTEVLLAAYATWGAECLHRLNGMFAFAIWDRDAKTLFCARDRMGVKPFVYTRRADGTFAFASEHKALVAAGLASSEYSADAVYEYLARGYTTGGRSFYADMEILPPGCAIEIDARRDNAVRQWTWWNPSTEADESRSFDDWAEEVGALLEDAVRLRLRSDVQVGAHLSGGLDSSAVVAAAAKNGAASGFLTFTGAFRDDAASDEREFSRAVAAMYGLSTAEVEIGIEDLAAVFERIVWHMDEPIAGPGVFPQMAVCDLAAAHRCTVVLGGQGGDELFGGYLRHRALHLKQGVQSGGPLSRLRAGLELARLAAGEWKRVKRTASRVGDADLSPEFLAAVSPEIREASRASALQAGSARELMLWDLKNYLPALLHVEDRTSMAASLESRTPLLDYRLVELALTIPERQLFAPGAPKPLLREAVKTWLPPSVANRTDKRGFPTPLQYWRERPALKSLVSRYTDATSADSHVPQREIFSKAYLGDLTALAPSQLWTVLTVQGWLEQCERGTSAAARRRAA